MFLCPCPSRNRNHKESPKIAGSALSNQPAKSAVGAAAPVSRAEEFKKNGGVLYIPNFLTNEEFQRTRDEVDSFKDKMRRETYGTGRAGIAVANDHLLASRIRNQEVANHVAAVTGLKSLHPSEFPVEARKYTKGAWMNWHSDTLLMDPPQVELVYATHNDTDSHTLFVDTKGVVNKVWAAPNSLLVVMGNGAPHKVTPTSIGERRIIKTVLAHGDSPSCNLYGYKSSLDYAKDFGKDYDDEE